jgi:hypothetical protein
MACGLASGEIVRDMASTATEHAETRRGAERWTDDELRASVGYRVDAPEGHLGVVEAIRWSGIPPRPLVLVVRALDRLYLLPPRRVAEIDPPERRLLLWPDPLEMDLSRRARWKG